MNESINETIEHDTTMKTFATSHRGERPTATFQGVCSCGEKTRVTRTAGLLSEWFGTHGQA